MKKTYDKWVAGILWQVLWFDVEWRRHTTDDGMTAIGDRLWFDVEWRRHTTLSVERDTAFEVVVWCRMKKTYDTAIVICTSAWVVVWCRMKKTYDFPNIHRNMSQVVVWCRMKKTYDSPDRHRRSHQVVVWCRMKKAYNHQILTIFGLSNKIEHDSFIIYWCVVILPLFKYYGKKSAFSVAQNE